MRLILFTLGLIWGCLCGSCQSQVVEDSPEKVYPTLGFLEKIHPDFDQIVPPTAKIEIIDSGHVWTEGPVWVAKENALLFSDVPQNIAYSWTEAEGRSVYLKPSGYTGDLANQQGSNGLFLDNKGEPILCQTGNRQVARLVGDPTNPTYESLATHYNEQRFNAPNDLVIDKLGNIYFTDPNFGLDTTKKEIPFQGVYKIEPTGEVQLLTAEHATPNGIGLSPDGTQLYIANSAPAYFVAYQLTANGVGEQTLFWDLQELWKNSVSRQPPDGMVVNKEGIIFVTGPDGVLVLHPNGTHLGTIRTNKLTANCAFNADESVLYVACHELILRVKLK